MWWGDKWAATAGSQWATGLRGVSGPLGFAAGHPLGLGALSLLQANMALFVAATLLQSHTYQVANLMKEGPG